jgi:glycosyltransferase involved in cell wall biosynthesis
LIVTVHDLAFVHHPTHFTRRGLRFFRRGLALARSEADLVLCSSRATMADLRAQGFEADRLRLVPWGVAPDLASEEQIEAVRDKYALGRPFVLWTGTIEPRKNLPGLIEAFRLLDDGVDLVLAGPEGWNVSLDALVATDRDRIKPIGFVPLQELRALYAGAAVFCYPSLIEGFGFPVLEAMVQGTPVVTSAGTSTEELARDAGVLVDPKDPRAIAAGLAQLLEDKELARRLVDAGRKRAAEYGWDRTARHLVSAYEEVIE